VAALEALKCGASDDHAEPTVPARSTEWQRGGRSHDQEIISYLWQTRLGRRFGEAGAARPDLAATDQRTPRESSPKIERRRGGQGPKKAIAESGFQSLDVTLKDIGLCRMKISAVAGLRIAKGGYRRWTLVLTGSANRPTFDDVAPQALRRRGRRGFHALVMPLIRAKSAVLGQQGRYPM